MGILKILSGQRDTRVNLEPFRYSAGSTGLPQQPRRVNSQPQRTSGWASFLAVGTLLLGAGSFIYVMIIGSKPRKERPFVYFEVKAVDDDGHSVAGASVFHDKSMVGITDSYGEWRRYLRVPLGSIVPLVIKKSTDTAELSATKNFAVPASFPKIGEIEIVGSVRLPKRKGTAIAQTPNEREQAPPRAAPMVPTPDVKEAARIPVTQSSELSVWFRLGRNDGSRQAQELSSVLSAMGELSATKGLTVKHDGDWVISVQHVSDPHDSAFQGLVYVAAQNPRLHRKVDCLRNYGADFEQTADYILNSVLSLIAPEQTRQPIFHAQLFGLPADADVFVGGLRARSAGKNLWAYRGTPGEDPFLSVLKDGNIHFRKLIHNRTNHLSILSIPLPASSGTRRM